MKAVVTTRYGPPAEVLRLMEVATPEPRNDEVRVKLSAAAVNALDSFTIRGPLFSVPKLGRLLKPRQKIAGADFAGRVEALGRNAQRFQLGDEVFGASFGDKRGGSFAQYVCARENNLALKPTNLSFEEAAAVPVAAVTALQGLRDHGQMKSGQKVLIDGASGGVGTFAVQIAKSLGAEVTAVCSPGNVEAVRKIGADHVIDYSREDFARSGLGYDVIFGANAHHSIFDYARNLNRDGVFVLAGGSTVRILQAVTFIPVLKRMGRKRFCFFIAKMNASDLTYLKDLLESGQVSPVIDKRYSLAAVAEALAYREEGHARGKIVITIPQVGEGDT